MLKRAGLWLGGVCATVTVALAILLLIGGPVAAQTAVRIFGTLSGAAKAVAVDSTGRVRVAIEGGGGTFDAPVTINVNDIGTTSTRGLSVDNSTAAAAGAQQYSPMACQEGQGWKTTATAASQSVEFCWEVQPVQGTTAPSGNYVLKASINGGAYSTVGTFTSGGGLTLPSNLVASGTAYGTNVEAASAGQIRWGSRTVLTSSTDGTIRVANAALSNTYDITLADWGTTLSAEGVSYTDTLVVSGPTSGVGTLTLSIGTDNNVCVFVLTGTSAPVEVTDPGTFCTITKDNASTVNVYYDTGYKIQNLRGGARTIRAVFIGG